MIPFENAIKKASLETSRLMSAHLRTETRASGWPEDVVRSMSVAYKDGNFNVNSSPKHKERVLDLEYGTPETQPTAAIRRFSNRTGQAEEFFTNRLNKMVGGYL